MMGVRKLMKDLGFLLFFILRCHPPALVRRDVTYVGIFCTLVQRGSGLDSISGSCFYFIQVIAQDVLMSFAHAH